MNHALSPFAGVLVSSMQEPLCSLPSAIMELMTPLAMAIKVARPFASLFTAPMMLSELSLMRVISSKRVFVRRIFFQPAS